ncbi:hypothetical protein OPT61_g5905 [Boeremia exigua]|uniref:Uncharacterized protein n=1 Tax=Boeremia exigua TaxID=749465 RepID=A0ACC2I8N3_9PLEO|nr:hypothetical protein OPT61_g5905 [Boeremia exigua]
MSFLDGGLIDNYTKSEDVPYVHVEVLGNGNSGLVEKVQHRVTKELFARKLIAAPKRRLAEQEAIFRNEIAVIRRLRIHHHFVRVFAAYRTRQHFGIILQPVADGGDLADYLESYHHRRDAAMQMVLQRAFGCLANGLTFMHAQRIRHKDIKPQNILIHQGNVLFTDFGYSLDSSNKLNSASEGRPDFLTRRYSAPEVLSYERRDSRSDVWSLGCVFIELFATLTQYFTVDETSCFAHEMERLRYTLHQLPLQPDCIWAVLRDLIITMTKEKGTSRSASKEVAARLFPHPGLMCETCHMDHGERPYGEQQDGRTVESDDDFQRLTTNTTPWTWTWSHDHQDYYRMTLDGNNQPLLVWESKMHSEKET